MDASTATADGESMNAMDDYVIRMAPDKTSGHGLLIRYAV